MLRACQLARTKEGWHFRGWVESVLYKHLVGTSKEEQVSAAIETVIFPETNDPITIVDKDGERWMTAQSVGRALGYTTRQGIHQVVGYLLDKAELEETVNTVLTVINGRDTRLLNLEAIIAVCMRSDKPKAVAFRKWARQVLKGYIKGELKTPQGESERTSHPEGLSPGLVSNSR